MSDSQGTGSLFSGDTFRKAEMRWMSVEDASICLPAREVALLGRLLSDVSSWIENYPLSDRADTKDDWRQLAARIREALS